MDPTTAHNHFSERLNILDTIDALKVKLSADAESSTRDLISKAIIRCKGQSPLSEWGTYDEIENYLNSCLTHVVEPRGTSKAMDMAVKKILAADEEYQRFLAITREMNKLQEAYDGHHENVLHGYWYAMDLGKHGVEEPPAGTYNPAAHSRYLELSDELTGAQPRTDLTAEYDRLAEARRKLDNRHQEWMEKHRRPPARLEGWSPENE